MNPRRCGYYSPIKPAKYGTDERYVPPYKTQWHKCQGCGEMKDFHIEDGRKRRMRTTAEIIAAKEGK